MEKHVAQSFDLFPIFSCVLYQLSTNFARLVCTFDLFAIIMIQVCETQCLRDDEEDLRIFPWQVYIYSWQLWNARSWKRLYINKPKIVVYARAHIKPKNKVGLKFIVLFLNLVYRFKDGSSIYDHKRYKWTD